jgi:hypothetical protein
MTDEDVDAWALSDPDFSWVNKIPDETLLSLLDKRFGVKKPDLFLSRKFYENLPTKDKHGDINYHADLFNRWATDWNTELNELIKSDCDLSHVNLRETLLTALSTYPLIHREAKQFNTKSAYALLAHLCDWVFQEEEAILSARNKRVSLGASNTDGTPALPVAVPHSEATVRPPLQQRAGGGAPRGNDAISRALLTGLTNLAQQLGVGHGERTLHGKPLPAWLKFHPTEGEKVICRGCNNEWQTHADGRTRSVPCYKGCQYVGHPHYNQELLEKDGKQNPPLTWRKFRERFPHDTPPAGFLRWEETQETRQRSGNRSPAPPKKHPRDNA